jgi:hypothetical protein
MVRDPEARRRSPPARSGDKIVFTLIVTWNTRDGSGYGKPCRASRRPLGRIGRGALGVVIHRSAPATHGFRTGATRHTRRASPLAISIRTQRTGPAFESGQPVRLSLKSSSRDLPQMRSANVVGDIPGTDLANEIVILGAHLDSWDPGVGALDDGAGVAIMMGVARLINELDVKPRRTIRVVLFANEEFGTSGSLAYVAATRPTLRHVLASKRTGAGPVQRLSDRVNPAQLPAVDRFSARSRRSSWCVATTARGGADLEV